MEEATVETTKKKVFLPIVVILILVVGALMLIRGLNHRQATLNTRPVELVEGGEIADFQLTSLDGTKTNLSNTPHKVMLINFWATWCEACIEEIPSMNNLREKYGSQGFEIFAVTVDEHPNDVVPPVAKKLKMNFPIVTDPGNVLATMFDVHAIPLSVVINKSRKILLVEAGSREWDNEETQAMIAKWLQD